MSDLIDRAQAQTELQFAARRYIVAHEANGEGKVVWSDNLISVTDAINALRKVPSAQLGTDCISRHAAIDALKKAYWDKDIQSAKDDPCIVDAMTDWAIRQVKALPSAQPEIIRCKDCKHWIPYDWMFSEIWQSRNMADYPEDEIGCDCCDMAMKANDFCSRSERRTDE